SCRNGDSGARLVAEMVLRQSPCGEDAEKSAAEDSEERNQPNNQGDHASAPREVRNISKALFLISHRCEASVRQLPPRSRGVGAAELTNSGPRIRKDYKAPFDFNG